MEDVTIKTLAELSSITNLTSNTRFVVADDSMATVLKRTSLSLLKKELFHVQTDSEFDTTNKTIIGAINELLTNSEYQVGDSISYSVPVPLSGLITNGGTDLYFLIPLDKPVNSEVSGVSLTNGTVIVRQNTKYCYGSAASTFVSAKSSECTITHSGIRCKYTMSNSTNVTNNDACALFLNNTLQITFS